MNQSAADRRSRLILPITAALLILLTLVQTVLYFTGYSFAEDLYVPGILPTLTAIVWVVLASLALSLALLLPKKALCEEVPVPRSPWIDYTALLSVAAPAAFLALVVLFRGSGSDALSALLTSASAANATAKTMLTLSLALALPAASYFALIFAKSKSYPWAAAALLLFAGTSALRVYFDMRYLLMSPRRILHLIALVALMIFAMAELRLCRGIVSRRLYVALTAPAVVLCGADGLSNLILALCGYIPLDSELMIYALLALAAAFALARLHALLYPKADPAPVEEDKEDEDTADSTDTAPIEDSKAEEVPPSSEDVTP